VADREGIGEGCSPLPLVRGQAAGGFEEGERIAAGGDDELLRDVRVDRPAGGRLE
jgi:hypothetical protein